MASEALTNVARAAGRQARAARALRQEVAAAHVAGEQVTDIAAAAEVGRQTVYRWLAMETQHVGGKPRKAIAEALRMMATHLTDPYQIDQLTKRADSDDDDVMVRGLTMGRSWLAGTTPTLSDDERAILAMATEAQNRLAALHSQG